MKYYVRAGETTHEVEIEGDSVTLDGEAMPARIESLEGTPLQLVTLGDAVHRILAARGERRGIYEISLDGHRIAVEALDERSLAIRDLSGAASRRSGPAHVVAPMPGLIVRVNVQEGDEVRAGQGLVVMEAMKMENELRAAAAGTVRRLVVSPGSVVEKGAMLLEMEG